MKTIGIYPGNFQPPTRAHLEVYKKLKQIVGPDTFVVTTDRTPTEAAPLNFGDKEQILVRHGIPGSHVIKVEDWKHPLVIFNKFSKEHTKVVYALNPKEAAQLQLNNQDETKYFQPYEGKENMDTLDKHAYVLIVDDSKIDNKPVSTANIRQALGSDKYTPDEKKKFFRFIFGWFDIGLYTVVTSKFRQAFQASSPDNQGPTLKNEGLKSQLQRMVREIMDEEYGMASDVENTGRDDAGTDVSKTLNQQKNDLAKQRVDLVKQKKEAEAKAKQNKQQRDQYSTTVKSYDSFQKKNDRDAIDTINTQLSKRVVPTV
jgi:nicotinamide mononucleotide adenylyltransferase